MSSNIGYELFAYFSIRCEFKLSTEILDFRRSLKSKHPTRTRARYLTFVPSVLLHLWMKLTGEFLFRAEMFMASCLSNDAFNLSTLSYWVFPK